MKLIRTLMLFVGALLTVAPQVHADVLIRLQSGATMRGSSSWVDGDTVKFMYRGGVIGFPKDQVVAVENAAPLPVNLAPVTTNARAAAATAPAVAAPVADRAASEESASARTAAATGAAPAKPSAAEPPTRDAGAAPGAKTPDAGLEAELAAHKDDDLLTRSERLDKLLLETHRELSTARYNQKPADEIERLQHRVDAINDHRQEAMRRLGTIH